MSLSSSTTKPTTGPKATSFDDTIANATTTVAATTTNGSSSNDNDDTNRSRSGGGGGTCIPWKKLLSFPSSSSAPSSSDDDDHWVIIPNGSYLGYFDWIPLHLRIGSWSMAATIYFRVLWIITITLFLNDCYRNNNDNNYNYTSSSKSDASTRLCSSLSPNDPGEQQHEPNCIVTEQQQYELQQGSSLFFPINVQQIVQNIVQRYWIENNTFILQQMTSVVYRSYMWYYHTIVALYMMFICYSIIAYSPLSIGAWITYTVQSWTTLMIRHLLYTLSGLFDTNNNNTFAVLAEIIRFPCAVAHSITFVVWNIILVPYTYYVLLRHEPKKQHGFYQFCTSFRLLNLHFMNIIFCICNVYIFNTQISITTSNEQEQELQLQQQSTAFTTTTTARHRTLEMADLYLAGILAFLYYTFYLCILDRIGIHLYPIFSPRHPNHVICIVWTSVIGMYIGTYYLWQYILLQK